MAVRRDGAVEIGQRLAVTQRTHLGHEPREQVEGTIGLGDEAGERLPPVAPLDRIAALDERAARGIGLVGWRQKSQRQIRTEEHTAELQSLMRISNAVFCVTKKNTTQ